MQKTRHQKISCHCPFKAESRLVQSVDSGRPSSPPSEECRSSSSPGGGADTPEGAMLDSGLEVTTSENTPFPSRPESELVLPEDSRSASQLLFLS